MTLRSALIAVVLAGCRSGALAPTENAPRVEPSELDFGEVFVGRSATRQVQVSSGSRASLRFEGEVEGPGFSAPTEVTLAGAEPTTIELTFTPAQEGSATGSLTLTGANVTLVVQLRGVARPAVICGTSSVPCTHLVADDHGICREVATPDDSACAEPCITGGRCLAGVCRGSPIDCDDRDACTNDRCSAERGCLHEATRCPSPADPCRAARCDPRVGCASVEVADGTSCGPNTCTTAKVCIAGQCREVTAPEGSECAPATACRPAGTCRNGQCERRPGTPLAPVWTFSRPPGKSLFFPGVADHAGNVYFLESNTVTTELVSLDRDGRRRFSVSSRGIPKPTSVFPRPESPLFLISDDRIAVLLKGPASTGSFTDLSLEVRSTSDGSLAWSKSNAQLATAVGASTAFPLWIMSAGTVGTPARPWLNLRTNRGGAAWSSWVLALEPATGAVSWSVPGDYLSTVVADQDAVYAYADLFGRRLARYDGAGGAIRWNLDFTGRGGALAGVADGRLTAMFPMQHLSAASGTQLFATASTHPSSSSVRMSPGRLVVIDDSSFCRRWFSVIDTSAPTTPVPWQSPMGSCLTSEPLLTARSSLLLGSEFSVSEVDLTGATHFECTLSTRVSGPALLAGRRWITWNGSDQISAYDLPVPGPAPLGWTAEAGSFFRANRPAE